MVRLKFLLVSKTRSSDRNRSNITQEYGEPAMACAPRSEINRIGRNSGNQPALEDPGGGGFLRCRTGCTASKRLRVEDHVLPDRNKTCPRILHSPRSLRQVDCSPGLSSPPGRSRPQKTLRHVTNELKVALAGHAAIWARHSPDGLTPSPKTAPAARPARRHPPVNSHNRQLSELGRALLRPMHDRFRARSDGATPMSVPITGEARPTNRRHSFPWRSPVPVYCE